jgi:hypothetical protein
MLGYLNLSLEKFLNDMTVRENGWDTVAKHVLSGMQSARLPSTQSIKKAFNGTLLFCNVKIEFSS